MTFERHHDFRPYLVTIKNTKGNMKSPFVSRKVVFLLKSSIFQT